MSNRELLKQLGWSDELIGECERTAATLTAGLPPMEEATDEPRRQLAVSGNAVDLFVDPVATESLYFVSGRRR